MRKMLSLFASVGMFAALAGCNNADTTNTITQVQQAAVAACSFLPTVETVANILSANATLVPMQIAQAICAAVTKPGVERGRAGEPVSATVMVGQKQISVEGYFVPTEE